MKVKCIDNTNPYGVKYINITIGKIYNVFKKDPHYYWIMNDGNCDEISYPKKCFKLLSEIRNEKIDKLLE
jgi:hypothetical protein